MILNNMQYTIIEKYFRLLDKKTVIFFLIVGASSALSYFLSFALLYSVLNLNYKIAVTIAYVISILVHFTGNRVFTFQQHGANLMQHVSKYLVMVLINYVITLVIMHIVVQNLHIIPYIGLAISIAATVGTGYLMSKYWVFS